MLASRAAVPKQSSLFVVHQVDSMEMLDSTSLYGVDSPKIVPKGSFETSMRLFGMFLKGKPVPEDTERQVSAPQVLECNVLVLPVLIESTSVDISRVCLPAMRAA